MDERTGAALPLHGDDRLILDLSLRCALSDARVAELLGCTPEEIKRRRNEVADRLADEVGARPPSGGSAPPRVRPPLRTLRELDDLWPRTLRFLPWALAAFLVMVCLVPFDAVQLPISLPLDAKLDRPFLVLLALLWVAGVLFLRPGERPRLRGSLVHWALLLFVATALVSVLSNAETLIRVDEFDLGVKKVVLLLSYVLLFLIVASSLKPLEVRRFIPLIVVLACIASVGAIVEYRSGYNAFYAISDAILPGGATLPGVVFEGDATGRIPIVGPTSHPLALAALMALALPFAMVGVLDSQGRRKVLYALGSGLILAGAMVTQRKTSAFALGVDVLVLTAYRPRQMRKLLPVGLVLVVAVSMVAPGAIGTVRDGLKPEALLGQVSTRDRQSDYDAVAPDIVQNPVTGRGYQTYDPEKYRVLDNEYLALLIGNGVLGLVAYVFVLLSVLIVCHRTIRSGDPVRGPPALAVAAGTAAVVVTSQLFDLIAFPHVPYMFMFMAGMAVACAVPARRREPAAAYGRVRRLRGLPRPEPAR
jgi:hypothetical protein